MKSMISRAGMNRFLRQSDAKTCAVAEAAGLRRELWGSRVRTRSKRGFELVQMAALYNRLPDEAVIVFGTWQGYGIPHNWIELPGGEIWEPISASIGPTEVQRKLWHLDEYSDVKCRFTPKEVARAAVAQKCTGDLYALGLFAEPEVESEKRDKLGYTNTMEGLDDGRN